jgi:cytochrome c biogenesis protein CcdA
VKLQNMQSDAVKAALLSALVIPGAGQLFNREWVKAIFIMVVFLASSLGFLIPITLAVVGYYLAMAQADGDAASRALQPMWTMQTQLITLVLVTIIIYVYSVIDAYRQCQRRMRQKTVERDDK